MSTPFPQLSEVHQQQIARATLQALVQWLPGHASLSPVEIVQRLDRVVLFLQQNGSPSRQAGQVTSLAFAWGMQVQRALGWQWVNAATDGTFNPALQSEDGRLLCCAVDVVTALVMRQASGSLLKLFNELTSAQVPADAELPHRIELAERPAVRA